MLLGLKSQEDDAKFFGFSKKAEDGPSRVGGLSKTFPEVPIEFRVSGSKQESRLIWKKTMPGLIIPRGLGMLEG